MDIDVPPPSPTFHTKHHHPYFTASQVEILSTKQRGKLSTAQEEKQRQQACSFIEAIGGRIGLYVVHALYEYTFKCREALERPSLLHKTCITDFTSTFLARILFIMFVLAATSESY